MFQEMQNKVAEIQEVLFWPYPTLQKWRPWSPNGAPGRPVASPVKSP